MLDIQGLHLTLNKLHILKGIDIQINSGETVGIIGPNGSGKTTLFNSISGFHQSNEGKLILNGIDLTRLAPYHRARLGIGRVFQNFGIFREQSLLENILIALETKQSFWATIWPWSRQNRINKVRALGFLRKVKLHEKANEKAASLSGGQMRLLEIIRTLAFGAELFLLDEPTAGVSPKMKAEISEIIKKLKKRQKTVLIIEHDINFIYGFCDRVIVLDAGRVVMDDTPENVRKNPRLQEIYFGTKD